MPKQPSPAPSPAGEGVDRGLGIYLVHLESIGHTADASSVGILTRMSQQDRFGIHHLVDTPEAADVILFSEQHLTKDWRLREFRYHPLRQQFPERCYAYDQRSRPWPALPGLFTSPPAPTVDLRYQVPWTYPGGSEMRQWLWSAPARDPDLLFSFTGSGGAACRSDIFALSHPRAVIERVEGFTFFDANSLDFEARRQRYFEVMLRSRFVLCPRGLATSSIRLYETLAAGRVPVIISDQWMPPAGPDWNGCSIRWPEAEVATVAAYLESIEHRATEMAAAARATYDDWYAPDVIFHRSIEALRPMVGRRAASHFPPAGIRRRQFIEVGRYYVPAELRHRAVLARRKLRAGGA